MTKDQKFKIWMDYVVTQITLKYDLSIDSGEINNEGWKYYPILNVSTSKIIDFKNTKPIRYKSFEEFSENLKDDRISEWYGGWYWRFKDRIKL